MHKNLNNLVNERIFLLVLAFFLFYKRSAYAVSLKSKKENKNIKQIQNHLKKDASKNNAKSTEIIEKVGDIKISKAVSNESKYVGPSLKAIPAVVFIKSISNGVKQPKNPLDDFFEEFFNKKFPRTERYKSQPRIGAGSGVIISSNGYIITNNHVVNGADKLEVILNNGKKYKAALVGADRDTDLALIKIEGTNLPHLAFADSDKLRVGTDVLAIGNPFGILKATVTRGIISATGRSRSKLNHLNPMEIGTFIQTDAIIDVGNSGGALIDLNANIVGINTARIAGYGFAVPSNSAVKVVKDLIKYGIVQKGILNIQGFNAMDAKEILDQPSDSKQKQELLKGLNENRLKNIFKKINGQIKGVLIVKTLKGKAAYNSGLKPYDIIIGIDGKEIDKIYEIQDILMHKYKPGDKVTVHFLRNGYKMKTVLTLETDTKYRVIQLSKQGTQTNNIEGAIFKDVNEKILKKLKLKNGVEVKELLNGKWKSAGIQKGFIITNIICLDCTNRHVEIDNIKTLCVFLNNLGETKIVIEGIYPWKKSDVKEMYAMYW